MKDDMSLKECNTWWKKEVAKHAIRNSNKPSGFKRKRFEVKPDISNFAPTRKGGSHARSTRSGRR